MENHTKKNPICLLSVGWRLTGLPGSGLWRWLFGASDSGNTGKPSTEAFPRECTPNALGPRDTFGALGTELCVRVCPGRGALTVPRLPCWAHVATWWLQDPLVTEGDPVPALSDEKPGNGPRWLGCSTKWGHTVPRPCRLPRRQCPVSAGPRERFIRWPSITFFSRWRNKSPRECKTFFQAPEG